MDPIEGSIEKEEEQGEGKKGGGRMLVMLVLSSVDSLVSGQTGWGFGVGVGVGVRCFAVVRYLERVAEGSSLLGSLVDGS